MNIQKNIIFEYYLNIIYFVKKYSKMSWIFMIFMNIHDIQVGTIPRWWCHLWAGINLHAKTATDLSNSCKHKTAKHAQRLKNQNCWNASTWSLNFYHVIAMKPLVISQSQISGNSNPFERNGIIRLLNKLNK